MAYLNLEIEIYPDAENYERIQVSYKIPQGWEGCSAWDLTNFSVIDIPMQFNQGFGDGAIQEAELSDRPHGEILEYPHPRGYRICRSGNFKRYTQKSLVVSIF